MPTELSMPRLGWDMKVGSVAEWLKRDGDHVEAGEPVCMIAGDKASVELEAPESGTLRLVPQSPEQGVDVPVGTLLAYLLAPGEEIPRAEPPRRTVASPRARRAAAAHGLDWRALNGSGRGGRVLERDVTALAQAAPAPIQTSRIRQLTADRMALSAQTVAPVTLTTEADATLLVRLRDQAIAEGHSGSAVPSYTDLLIKVAALALTEHPALNGDHAEVNVAIAVDTDSGLLAPVVSGADGAKVEYIARETRRLIDEARAGKSRPEDLGGATFTITNLGMYDIDAFTPIVNLPQCAILGVGRIVARPVVIDEATEQVAVRRMLTLSLTFDHRIVDGAPAARFLQRIKHLVERPTLWLFR